MVDRRNETTERLTRQRERAAVASKNFASPAAVGVDPRAVKRLSELLVRMKRTEWAIDGYPGLFALFNRGGRARNNAARELAKRPDFVSARCGDPRARRRIARMGKRAGFRYMVEVVIPAAILEAADELVRGDRKGRIGKEWVVGLDRKISGFNPFDLSAEKLLALLRQRAQAHAEQQILEDPRLDSPKPPGVLSTRLSASSQNVAARRLLAALRRNPRAAVTITSLEAEVARATVAGVSVVETAIDLGKTTGAVRAARHRLLRRLRPA